jgi:sulfur relay (sulfurtransferase) complex TusBCD TusD component (DsrE family)
MRHKTKTIMENIDIFDFMNINIFCLAKDAKIKLNKNEKLGENICNICKEFRGMTKETLNTLSQIKLM